MAKKIVALDVLIGILKQVYNKTKEYTKNQISIEVKILSSLITTNNNDIKTLQTTTNNQKNTINELSGRLGNAESNIALLQDDLEIVKSNVTDLQGKVYDYLGNDEIDTVFE